MTITIDPKLEARLRERAEAQGLSVPDYVERLVSADRYNPHLPIFWTLDFNVNPILSVISTTPIRIELT